MGKEVMQCMDNNQSESVIMPLEDSLVVMKMMDGLRKQWGLKYPME